MRRVRSLTVVLAVLALAGCGSEEEAANERPAATTNGPATTGVAESRTQLLVYLLRNERIAAAARVVTGTTAVGRAALEELLGGRTEGERQLGLGSAIPRETRLLGLSIADGIAIVDLTREFTSGGGSLSMQARAAQVVYTLTQFPTVEAVDFRVEGEPLRALGGEGLLLDGSSTRADFEDVTPPVLVESPTPGADVRSPVRIQGTANTFEATFMAEIVDASGNVVAQKFVTATSGSGTRGTFDDELAWEEGAAGPGALVVYELSAEDGSRTHEVEIPVLLAA